MNPKYAKEIPSGKRIVQPLTEKQLLAPQRAGYYETVWPSEHTDLWRSHAVSDVGLPADFDPARLTVTSARLNLRFGATSEQKMKCLPLAEALPPSTFLPKRSKMVAPLAPRKRRLPQGSWVRVSRTSEGGFDQGEWVDLNYHCSTHSVTSSNSVYGNQVVGIVIGADPFSYQATVVIAEPA